MRKINKYLILSLSFFLSTLGFAQNNLVPNTASCSGVRPPFSFNIQPAWNSQTNNDVSNGSTPLAGDLDGDGITEVVAIDKDFTKLYVFDGRNGSVITTLTAGGSNGGGAYGTLICQLDGKGSIFNVGPDFVARLYTVSSAPGVRPITFNLKWTSTVNTMCTYQNSTMPVVTDFDGDGIPEFVVGAQIVDSQNGAILATMDYAGTGTYPTAYPIAVDFDKDGLPEVAVGTNVYKFSRNTNPKLQLWRSLANIPGGDVAREGNCIAADINQDGETDIAFHSSSGTEIVVWTPNTNTIIGTITGLMAGQRSYPFIGDIDGVIIGGKKYPEILINATNQLNAYTFNGTSFVLKWTMAHSDRSGGTAMTLFDFNNDEVVEIVYRDETLIHIFDGSGSAPVSKYTQTCGSITGIETPIIADVNGDGSADIVVTGNSTGAYVINGEVMVFEGGASKWASCPNVWNQQLYSPLYVNTDLSIPRTIKSLPLTFTQTCEGANNKKVQFYNGSPIQAPYVSEDTYCPIDLSPDVFVISGKIKIINTTTVEIEVTFGNQGMATAPGSMPIRFYKNSITTSNILSSASTTLGADLPVGQTVTITKTITGLSPMPAQFYVRVMDDGTNFPALGAFSDCNLTNNTKSFGTLELIKRVDYQTSCIDGVSTFTVKLTNNTDQTTTPLTYDNIILTDSLGAGWQFLTVTPIGGSITSAYNTTTRKLGWTIASLAPGDSVKLVLTAKSIAAGDARNTIWVESTGIIPILVGKEAIQAYVIVANQQAPAAPAISPANPQLCPSSVLLAASGAVGATGYQWYKNGVTITGATNSTYLATSTGNYTVNYFNGTCVSQISTAVTVGTSCVLPDNIQDTKCYGDIPTTPFSFTLLASSPHMVENYGLTVVGDIDNDGKTEIITPAPVSAGVSSNELQIFEMGKNNVITRQQRLLPPYFNVVANPYAIANVDGGPYAAIFLALSEIGNSVANQRVLIKLTYDGTQYVETKRISAPYSSIPSKENGQPMVADFNGDGIPEVVIYDKVYNARTLELLADGNYLSNPNMGFGYGGHINNNYQPNESSSLMAVADVDGDNLPEVIGGNCVYKVNITNPSGMAGNSFTLWSKCDQTGPLGETHTEAVDGATAVADMDGDGLLDVVVTVTSRKNPYSPTHGALYIWNPRTKKVMNSNILSAFPSAVNYFGPSVAFIGDIDNDKQPEVCLTADRMMYAYDYDLSSKALNLKWSKTTNDASGATTMSMFDFDQDGNCELVYRDQTHLRILKGIDGSDMIIPISNTSGTANEYPVIADVNGDGRAEIIVNGTGYTRVYASDPVGLWAPARKVWNQFSYNVVNINEDLTVPKFQFNPATVFPGTDGVFNTADDVRPYNGYLMQQTILNNNGVSVFPLPDITWNVDPTFTYHPVGDSLSVHINIKNVGDASIGKPVYLTVYKSSIISIANKLETGVYNGYIAADESVQFIFTVKNFMAKQGTEGKITVRLNDDGTTFPYQQECVTTDDEKNLPLFVAADDHVQTTKDVAGTFDVLANDLLAGFPVSSINGSVTNGSNGTAVWNNTTKKVTYTSAPGFVGRDTITYTISSGGLISTAKIYIMVVEMPDNMSDADCYGDVKKTDWDIQVDWSSTAIVSPLVIPLVGDLNGDGVPEIVCFGTAGRINLLGGINATGAKTILVYNGKTHALLKTITMPSHISEYDAASYGLVKVPGGKGLIVVATIDYKLRAYDITKANADIPVWTSNIDYGSVFGDFGTNLGFADFNNDGYPEVYLRDKIYDASTGVLLATATGGSNKGLSWAHWTHQAVGWKLSSPMAADMDGDGKLELILGNEIYNVNITSRTGIVGNSITLSKTIVPPSGVIADGHAQIVDFDKDGHLDVLITNRDAAGTTGKVSVYVWDVYRNVVSTPLVMNTDWSGKSIPLIADIDNDGQLEIVIQCALVGDTKRIRAYKYDVTTRTFSYLWGVVPNEDSFSNSATLFDFNLDGQNEVLITDQTQVRIFDGATATQKSAFSFVETTVMQYPVIADVDGDGSAEIIAVGGGSTVATLNIFKSLGAPWAPARKVWNQYMYNSVNINEDLTVPKIQLSPATVFPGKNGVLGDIDDVRPYNNFLQQQTILNNKGVPLFLLPDARIIGTPTKQYYSVGDSLVITVQVKNQGDAALQSPVYVAAYKDAVATANVMRVYQYPSSINVDETKTISFKIPNISSFKPFNKVVVKINDKGNTYTYQQECDSVINQSYDMLMGVMANNDTVSTTKNTSKVIDVLANDLLPNCTRSNISIAQTNIAAYQAKHGTVTFNANKDLIYTPANNWVGVDSLRYVVTDCNNVKDSAMVYIITLNPNALNYVACPGAVVTMGFSNITGVTYYWYNAQTGGTIVTNGNNTNSLTITKGSAADIGTWWVEARYGTMKFPRYRVDLNLSASCGGTPVSCAVDGTLLFREDFGAGTALVSNTPLPVGVTTYTFKTGPDINPFSPNDGFYSIGKKVTDGGWWGISDHSDPGKGYMMVVNADHTPGQFFQYSITGLCGGTTLYFSAWIHNLMKSGSGVKPRLRFEIIDANTNVILAQYNTGDIPVVPIVNQWKQYGFSYISYSPSVILRIYNEAPGGGGNDLALDDIEVRLCAPPVTATVNGKLSDTICNGTVTLDASYTDNGAFVTNPTDKLEGYWMQSATGNVNNPAEWSKVTGSDVTGTAGSTSITIPSFTTTPQSGVPTYYRFVISNSTNVNSPNCRAASAVLPVMFFNSVLNYPDIRVQTCVAPNRAINLSSYLDTLDFVSVNWTTIAAPSVTPAGVVQTNTLIAPNTYVYKYAVTNHCIDTTARLYLTTIGNNTIGLPPREVVICYENAANIQLNQILGVEVGGMWTYNAAVAPYVKTAVAPAIYAGAKIFDGKGLYEALKAANSSQFKVTYNGDTDAREIIFTYTVTDLSSCLAGKTYTVKVILTSKLVP